MQKSEIYLSDVLNDGKINNTYQQDIKENKYESLENSEKCLSHFRATNEKYYC